MPSHSEGFASTLGGLPTSTNASAVRMGNRPSLPNATTGIVGQQKFQAVHGQSPPQQKSSSLPVTAHHSPHMQSLAMQEHQQTHKTSQFPGDLQKQYIQDLSTTLPSNVQVGNLQKPHQRNLQDPVPSVTSYLKHQHLGTSDTKVSDKIEKLSPSKGSLVGETSDQSTPSSLLAAVMKSGIFNSSIMSNLASTSVLDTRILPLQSGDQATLPGGPQGKIASPSLSGTSNDDSSTLKKISQVKAGQPSKASDLPLDSSTVSSASNSNTASSPMSNLLSSLVAKGLISAKLKSSTKVSTDTPTQLEDQSHSISTSSSSPVASVSGSLAVPVSSIGDEVDHDVNSSVSLSQSTTTEIRNLIGFEFKPDVIRQLHPSVISELLGDLPHHCSLCGLRLKHQEQLNGHLDWHAKREGAKLSN